MLRTRFEDVERSAPFQAMQSQILTHTLANAQRQLEPANLPAEIVALQHRVHERLLAEIDQQRLASLPRDVARRSLVDAALEILATEQQHALGDYRLLIIESIADDVIGYGPLEPLLRDGSITEIMVNGPFQIWVERRGRISKTGYAFRDQDHLLRIIERIVSPLGRHVDEANPMVDARLPDGSRVNVVLPPAAPRGATITLRKFARERLMIDDLVRSGSLSELARDFLKACVQAKLNIIVSGGTGTGKTTLLNVLSSFIGEDERIITVEDPLELQLQQPHVVSLEARPPGVEGSHQISQRDLVRNALRMRPDRILVGEVRGGEAFDMLQAMNTGHDGSIGTVHANTPRDALARIQNMVLMSGLDLPDQVIRDQIVSAIDLVVQIARMTDGSRRVTQISEVSGIEGSTPVLRDIFVLEMVSGADSEERPDLIPTGAEPGFADRFSRHRVSFALSALQREGQESIR